MTDIINLNDEVLINYVWITLYNINNTHWP